MIWIDAYHFEEKGDLNIDDGSLCKPQFADVVDAHSVHLKHYEAIAAYHSAS